jgi:hypothetical protein
MPPIGLYRIRHQDVLVDTYSSFLRTLTPASVKQAMVKNEMCWQLGDWTYDQQGTKLPLEQRSYRPRVAGETAFVTTKSINCGSPSTIFSTAFNENLRSLESSDMSFSISPPDSKDKKRVDVVAMSEMIARLLPSSVRSSQKVRAVVL